MRVTLVSPFDPFPHGVQDGDAHVGGVERVYAELAPRLADRGHDVTVVCSTDGAGGTTVEGRVRVVRTPRSGTILRAPMADLSEAIGPTDVVQVPATYPLTTPRIVRDTHDAGIPCVLDFHFEPHPGSLVGRMAAALYRPIGARVYPQADRVLARSEAYAEQATSLSRVPEDRVRIVPNGIDPDRFTPEGPAREGDYLLFVGRLVPYKGLETLLEALRLDPVDRPLLVAGEGPLRDRLETRAERAGLDVRFLGRVDDDDLAPLYRGAGLTLLPSVNRQEAFGITLLESMACGTPVLASDLPGVADVAEWGGLVAPPGDPRRLADRLREASDAWLPEGQSLARRIHAAFSWESVADRTEAVYEEIAGSDPGPGTQRPRVEVGAR